MNSIAKPLLAALAIVIPGASDELAGHWKLDEGSGSTVSDSSGKGHSGKLEKGGTWVEGRSGRALSLDGQDDFVRVPRTPALEPPSVTVACWVKRNGVQATWTTLIKKTWKNNGGPTYGSWSLQLNPKGEGSDRVAFQTGAAQGSHTITSSTGAAPDGAWIHVAGVYDPAGAAPQKRLYVNGGLVALADESRPLHYDPSPTGDLYFGQSGAASEYFKGALDDVLVYARALSESEIKALCPGTEPPKPPPAAVAVPQGKGKAERLTFTERHPLANLEEYCRRGGWSLDAIRRDDPKGGEYDLASESFEAYIPSTYDPEAPSGLFVYTNSTESGKIPPEWVPAIEKFSLIWIGANNSGNDRKIWYRTNLALDAVHNMCKRYAIDRDRIYVGGPSGGGRSASMTALMNPDVFAGGYFMIGCDYFRNTDVVGGSTFFPASFSVPAPPLLERAKTKNRYAIFTGDKDHMKSSCLSAFENGFKKDKFAFVDYFEAKNWGHTHPDAEWFEKGVGSLDVPLRAAAPLAFAGAQKAEKAGKLREALGFYEKAATHGRGEKFETEARERAKDLRARLEASSQDGFAKLQATKPTAQRLRDFAKEWQGYEGGAKAAEEANRQGEDELTKISNRTANALRQALQKFLKDWEGYPVGMKALETLDREAEPEFDKIREVTPDKARHAKLMDFGVLWLPSKIAKKALETVESEIRPALNDIKALKTDPEKLPKLLALARDYKDVPAGKEAKALADSIIARSKK